MTLQTQAEVSTAPLVPLSVDSALVDLLDEREALKEMRRLGIERNEEVLARIRKNPTNVPWSLDNIRRRVAAGKNIKNITGAFMTNLVKPKGERDPIDNEPSFGLHKELNPPTEHQLQALEVALTTGLIRDVFVSSTTNTRRVIKLDGFTQVDWWEFLGVK